MLYLLCGITRRHLEKSKDRDSTGTGIFRDLLSLCRHHSMRTWCVQGVGNLEDEYHYAVPVSQVVGKLGVPVPSTGGCDTPILVVCSLYPGFRCGP